MTVAEETHFYNTFLNRGDPVFGEFNLDNFFVNNAVNIGVLEFLLVLEILKAMFSIIRELSHSQSLRVVSGVKLQLEE